MSVWVNLGRFGALWAVLGGCATPPEIITKPEVIEVKVEVSRPCPALGKVGEPPKPTAATELAQMDDYEFVLAIAEDRARLAAYAELAGPAIAGCRGP